MPTIGETILDLILAEQDSAANDALSAGHPAAFLDTCRATIARSAASAEAASVSSVTIGTGSKFFALVEARGWREGMPVYIMDAGDPSTNFLVGKLSADETSAGEITVNVTLAGGSGTYTNWIILALFAATTVASPPLAIADGGTGATTKAIAKENLEAASLFHVLHEEGDPTILSPSAGDRYLVMANAFDVWVGHENEIAEWDGADWIYTDPPIGSLIYFDDSNELLVRAVPGPLTLEGGTSDYRYINVPRLLVNVTSYPGGGSVSADYVTGRQIVVVTTPGSTVTLPDMGQPGYELTIQNASSGSITIDVAASGTINNSASKTQAAYSARRYYSGTDSGGNPRWFTEP